MAHRGKGDLPLHRHNGYFLSAGFPFLNAQVKFSECIVSIFCVPYFHFLSAEFPVSEGTTLDVVFRVLSLQFLSAKFAFFEHRSYNFYSTSFDFLSIEFPVSEHYLTSVSISLVHNFHLANVEFWEF